MQRELDAAALIAERGAARSTGSEMLRGLKAALPVMISFVPFALVLGSQATRKGMDGVMVPIMTALNFGGGSEFAAVELWTSPPHVALIVAITLLINSRHLLMGAVLSQHLRALPTYRALLALFFMCDESWAMSLADAKRRVEGLSLPYYLGVSMGLYLTWVSFTAAGALLGPAIGDPTALGLDMAFPAVFLVMLRGMWKGTYAARPWAISLVAAVGTYLLVPGAWYVVSGALSGVVAAYLRRESVG
jgi:4-azaleucine resistance transporter AzlC